MKKIFLAIFAVAAMASCSKNEVTLDGAQKAIGFAPAQFGNTVINRADGSELKGSVLGVFAYQAKGNPTALYINDELSYQTDSWKLGNTYYWPTENSELKFFAYGPKATNNGITAAGCNVAGTPTFSYEIKNAATDVIVDLSGQTVDKNTVTFNLSHVLTQLLFKAQLSAKTNANLTVKINSITVKAHNKGDFSIVDNNGNKATWTNLAGTLTSYVALNTDTEVTAVNGSSVVLSTPTLNMIPANTTAQIVVVAAAYDKSTGSKINEKTVTISFDGTSAPFLDAWTAGTQVTYTLTLNADDIANEGGSNAIEFGNPTVVGWGTGTGGDINM